MLTVGDEPKILTPSYGDIAMFACTLMPNIRVFQRSIAAEGLFLSISKRWAGFDQVDVVNAVSKIFESADCLEISSIPGMPWSVSYIAYSKYIIHERPPPRSHFNDLHSRTPLSLKHPFRDKPYTEQLSKYLRDFWGCYKISPLTKLVSTLSLGCIVATFRRSEALPHVRRNRNRASSLGASQFELDGANG